MNKLIITEKPSVGVAYAALLGAKKRTRRQNDITRSTGISAFRPNIGRVMACL